VATAAGDRAYTFTEDIETALGCTKQSDNAKQLVGIVESLEIDTLPVTHEIRGLSDALRTFCAPPAMAN
jgi:hypothetical protein